MKPNDKARLFDSIGTSFATWCCETAWPILSKISIAAMIVLWCLVSLFQYPHFNQAPAKPGQGAYFQAMILQVPLCDRSNLNTARAQARLLGGPVKFRSGTGGEDEASGGMGAVAAQFLTDLPASGFTGWTPFLQLVSDDRLHRMHAATRGPPAA